MDRPVKLWVEPGKANNDVFYAYAFMPGRIDGMPRPTTEYIRSELVEKLIERTPHAPTCLITLARFRNDSSCTCGLDDLINEIRG